MMTDTPTRYALSFTSGALLMREALVAAPIYLREHDWAKVRELIEEDNLLQSRTRSSGFRLAREVAQRLSVLTDAEIELLIDSTTSERGHLLWAAACRRYDLIGEFAEEVLRERYLILAPTLGYGDFDIVFLTDIGEVFPYIRSHNVLNNLQSVVTGKPMLMFFPGRYEQSDTIGSSLVLFGRLKEDQYYRAKNILEQEA